MDPNELNSVINGRGHDEELPGPAQPTLEEYLRKCLVAGRGGKKEDLERALRSPAPGDRLLEGQLDSLVEEFVKDETHLRILQEVGVQLTNTERGSAAKASFASLAWRVLRSRPGLENLLTGIDHASDIPANDVEQFFRGLADIQSTYAGPGDSVGIDRPATKLEKKTVQKNEAALAGLCLVLVKMPFEAVVIGMAKASIKDLRPRAPGEGITTAAEWLQGRKVPRQLIGLLEEMERSREVQVARERKEKQWAADRAATLADEVKKLELGRDELLSLEKSLRADLAAEQERSRDKAIGLRQDLYRISHSVLRALEDEIEPRLQESLKALGRDPPKTAVAIEYVGKALDLVEEQIQCLKS